MAGNLCGMLKKGGARPAHRCPASPNSTGKRLISSAGSGPGERAV